MTTITIPPRTVHGWLAALANSRLPVDVKAVGYALADRADEDLAAAPGIAALRAATDSKEWVVIRGLHDLQMTGWVEKIVSRKPFLADTYDVYRLLGGKL
ncbi:MULTISPECIES: hypothetical protein [unclassified Rhodococcus (in: high G+C Gram-positive bacteria)]|uniref:hypothetical protein n=1 Tax=unclassified Rhodococcus (in: high G+C Gram-positive bacteria) TaxID=192944 RepID=UPI00339934FF